MFKLLREYKLYVTIGVLILLPILAMNLRSPEKQEYGFVDRAILFVTAPAQDLITLTIDKVSRVFQNYIFLMNLRQDYNSVVEENRRLNNTLHNFHEMEAENKRLRALLQFQEKLEDAQVTAQVIAKDVSSEFKSIRINKGSRAGIERGMPVVTHEGVVGKVLKTTSDYADVLTIYDDLSAVDAIVQRSRAHGVVEGLTDSTCALKYALRTDDIEVGDTIITSGLDTLYPKGLMVGNVVKVTKKSYGISQDIELKPNVNFSRLEEVLVILKQDKHIL